MIKTAAELRNEAARLREFALTVTDPEILAEINLMIAEWERRARLLDNGGATALSRKLMTDSEELCRRASYFRQLSRATTDENTRIAALILAASEYEEADGQYDVAQRSNPQASWISAGAVSHHVCSSK